MTRKTPLLLPLALLLALSACKPAQEPTPASSQPPAQAPTPTAPAPAEETPAERTTAEFPTLKMKAVDGSDYDLAAHRGKWVVVNFWATWCGPCRNEMPDIQKLYDEYSAQGEDAEVVILGIAGPGIGQEKSAEEIADFMTENGYTYPVLMDTSGEMFTQYGISAFPTTFMIDKDGNVYGYVPGQMTEDIMRSIIDQTLENSRE